MDASSSSQQQAQHQQQQHPSLNSHFSDHLNEALKRAEELSSRPHPSSATSQYPEGFIHSLMTDTVLDDQIRYHLEPLDKTVDFFREQTQNALEQHKAEVSKRGEERRNKSLAQIEESYQEVSVQRIEKRLLCLFSFFLSFILVYSFNTLDDVSNERHVLPLRRTLRPASRKVARKTRHRRWIPQIRARQEERVHIAPFEAKKARWRRFEND